MKKSNIKKRNWAFLVYPDSAPTDWIQQLQQTGLQIALSPLHDKDLDATGEPKKPHYHVIICYSGPTSFNVVKRLTDALNQRIPIALEQIKGYYRYFTHIDNPDKYQYDQNDIQTVNGFDVLDFVELTRSEKNKLKQEICIYIIDHKIYEYSDLNDYCFQNNPDWFDIVSSNTYYFHTYLSSRRSKLFNEKRRIDTLTGEVIG